MLQTAMKHSVEAFGAFVLMLLSFAAQAQDKVEIDTQEVKSWFENNWIWVAGGVVLLLLVMLLGRRRSGGQRKTTTVIKDPDGHVKSVTTTEEKI